MIVDHLTPPLTRAESYGPLRDLERLVDEYYDAAGLDPRRADLPARARSSSSRRATGPRPGLSASRRGDDRRRRARQARHPPLRAEGAADPRRPARLRRRARRRPAHRSAGRARARAARRGEGRRRLAACARSPRDLGLDGFDPLDCRLARALGTARGRDALQTLAPTPGAAPATRSSASELLARRLVGGSARARSRTWAATARRARLDREPALRPALDGLRRRRDRRPARRRSTAASWRRARRGAPTRGRPDVLPTGRNFYSVDTPRRADAGRLAARLEVGVRCCSSATSRTTATGRAPGALGLGHGQHAHRRRRHRPGAGADRARARPGMPAPAASPASRSCRSRLLDRPRVDVTLRVSGFFRDAFPAQIELFDSAAPRGRRARRAGRAEPDRRARPRRRAALIAQGVAPEAAPRGAGFRVFGSKPGAYGAGLQALIDERGWESDADLAARLPRLGRLRLRRGRPRAPPRTACSSSGSPRSSACCTTRTTASTTCSTPTTTTSSRAGSRRR